MDTQSDSQLDNPDQGQSGQGQGQGPEAGNDIPEVTPTWLQALLQKYGEREGPLAGAPTFYPSAPSLDFEEGGLDDISGVLEDIASDTTPHPQTGRLASSVDWGVAPEADPATASSAMDDFLASFEEPTLDDTSPPGPQVDTPGEDWLSEGAGTAEFETSPDFPAAPTAEPVDDTPDELLEAPDWLSDLSESDSLADPVPPSQAEQRSTWDSKEIPDWLRDADPAADDLFSETAPAQGQPEVEEDDDWLDLANELQAQQDAPEYQADPSAAEASTWLSELVTPETSTPGEPPRSGDSPDDASEVPDWLVEFAATERDSPETGSSTLDQPASSFGEADRPTSQTESASEIEVPDWLAELDASRTEGEAPSEPPPAEMPASFAGDTPEEAPAADWLTELGFSPESDEQLPQGEAEASDWLADIIPTASPEAPGVVTGDDGEADDEAASLDWLSAIGPPSSTAEDFPSAEPLASAEDSLKLPASPPATSVDLDDDEDWLQELALHYPVDPAAQDVADETPAVRPPQPAEDMVPFTPPELPPVVEEEPAAEKAGASLEEILDDTALPDWMVAFEEEEVEPISSGADIEVVFEEAEDKGDTLDWLAEMESETEAMATESPVSPERDSSTGLLNWLAEIDETKPEQQESAGPSEEMAGDEAETSDWLAELRAEGDQRPSSEEDEPAAVTPDLPPEPAEDTYASEETDDSVAELPAWLANIEAEPLDFEATGAATVDASPESDWLSELQQEADTPPVSAPEAEIAPEEAEEQDWLAGLRAEAITQEETPFAAELPDWLIDVEEPEAGTDSVGETAAEDAGPSDWLAELRTETETAERPGEADSTKEEAPVAAEAPAAEDAGAGDTSELVGEPFDWSVTGETSAVEETDLETDLPDWLGGLEQEDAPPLDRPAAGSLGEAGFVDESSGSLPEAEETEPEAAAQDVETIMPQLAADEPADITVSELERVGDSETLPAWLVELEAEAKTVTEIGLPAWVIEMGSEVAGATSEAPTPSTEVSTAVGVVEEETEAAEKAELDEIFKQPAEPLAELDVLADDELLAPETKPPAGETSELDETKFAAPAPDQGVEPSRGAEAVGPQEDETTGIPPAADWLSELRIEAAHVEPTPPEEANLVADMPDWMIGLDEEPQAFVPAEPAEQVDQDETITAPDWLSELRAETAETAQTAQAMDEAPAVFEEPVSGVDLPDWMIDFEEPPETEVFADTDVSGEAGVAAEAETPAQERVEGAAPASMPASPPEVTEEEPQPPAEAEFMADVPDWMLDLESPSERPVSTEAGDAEQETAPTTSAADSITGSAEVESAADEQDWLSALRSTTSAEPPLASSETEFVVDMPDWMRDLPEEETDEAAETEFSLSDSEVVPPWMVDFEAADETPTPGAGDTDPPPDAAGRKPLAGLFSSSPMPPTASDQTKTGDVPAGAQAKETEESLDQDEEDDDASARPVTLALAAAGVTAGTDAAQRFFNITTAVPETSVLPGGVRSETPNAFGVQADQSWLGRILRASLYLALALIISIPLFNHFDRGGYPFPWLEPSLAEQEATRNSLQGVLGDKLPGSIALVSFDYTSATEGEMTPLAREVIKKLRGQGLRVIAISLEPEGPAMAQRVFDQIAPDSYGIDVLNLGFRAGGLIAVRQLAFDNPLDGALDFETQQRYGDLSAWPEINHLDDIAVIVELSATPDAPRWWVEQLEAVTSPPMLAVVSAAAEPFILPYVNTGQYEAVIAGINGAAALESTRTQETLGPASSMLDSQSVAHLVIMTLMLFGTIAGLFAKYGREST